MLFAFVMRAMKTMHPVTFGSVSTQMMCIMLVGVLAMPDHSFLQNVSRISFLCPSAIDLTFQCFVLLPLTHYWLDIGSSHICTFVYAAYKNSFNSLQMISEGTL